MRLIGSVEDPGLALTLAVVALAWLVGCDDVGGRDDWRIPSRPMAQVPELCIGPEVPEQAWSAEPAGQAPPPDAGVELPEGPPPGSPPPDWQLADFQPQSCGFGAVYGMEAFRGRVTVVALWAGS